MTASVKIFYMRRANKNFPPGKGHKMFSPGEGPSILFSLRSSFQKLFPLEKGHHFFFGRRAFQNFFPGEEESKLFFLDFPPASPQIIIGRFLNGRLVF